MLGKKLSCPHCDQRVSQTDSHCPSCGEALTLRRKTYIAPHQTLLDLNKFFIIAAIFIILLIPLGYCVRPG